MPKKPEPRLAHSLRKLREQIDALFANRSKLSDGWIGDLAHSNRTSDHNPDPEGVVHAIDITHDPDNGFDAEAFAERMRTVKDRRLKYLIFNKRIFSATVHGWEWRKYAGSNTHEKHVHISVTARHGDDGSEWRLTEKRHV